MTTNRLSLAVLVVSLACSVEPTPSGDLVETELGRFERRHGAVMIDGRLHLGVYFVQDGHVVTDGDILVGPVDELEAAAREELLRDAMLPVGRRASALVGRPDRLWPDGRMPYVIEDVPDRGDLEWAIAEWNANVPFLQLVPRGEEDDFVVFRRSADNGCNAMLGRAGGVQYVNVADWCRRGSLLHEIAHAAGVMHEHQRADAAFHIAVDWGNVAPERTSHFLPHPERTTRARDIGAFDFDSVMLYSSFSSFGIDLDRPVMVRRTDGSTWTGQRERLSAGDIGGLAELYLGSPPCGAATPEQRGQCHPDRGRTLRCTEATEPGGTFQWTPDPGCLFDGFECGGEHDPASRDQCHPRVAGQRCVGIEGTSAGYTWQRDPNCTLATPCSPPSAWECVQGSTNRCVADPSSPSGFALHVDPSCSIFYTRCDEASESRCAGPDDGVDAESGLRCLPRPVDGLLLWLNDPACGPPAGAEPPLVCGRRSEERGRCHPGGAGLRCMATVGGYAWTTDEVCSTSLRACSRAEFLECVADGQRCGSDPRSPTLYAWRGDSSCTQTPDPTVAVCGAIPDERGRCHPGGEGVRCRADSRTPTGYSWQHDESCGDTYEGPPCPPADQGTCHPSGGARCIATPSGSHVWQVDPSCGEVETFVACEPSQRGSCDPYGAGLRCESHPASPTGYAYEVDPSCRG